MVGFVVSTARQGIILSTRRHVASRRVAFARARMRALDYPRCETLDLALVIPQYNRSLVPFHIPALASGRLQLLAPCAVGAFTIDRSPVGQNRFFDHTLPSAFPLSPFLIAG